MNPILYIVLAVAILFVAFSPKRSKESELSDFRCLEHLEVIDVTVNQWLVSLIFASGLLGLHIWIRLRNSQINTLESNERCRIFAELKTVC